MRRTLTMFSILAVTSVAGSTMGECYTVSSTCEDGAESTTTTFDSCRNTLFAGNSWAAADPPGGPCIPLGTCYNAVSCPGTVDSELTVASDPTNPSEEDTAFSGQDQCESAGGLSWQMNTQGANAECIDFGAMGGDPHFRTFRGNKFDYQGECDLVLVHNPTFANGTGLDIHIRTTRFNYFSFVESVAIKIGNEVMQIDNQAQFRIGQSVYSADDDDTYPTNFAGYSVTHEKSSKMGKDTHVFQLTLDSSFYHHESIKIHAWDMFLGIFVNHGDLDSLFEGSSGMMGDFSTGDMVGRDGMTVVESTPAFAAEWQVHSDGTDPVLFHERRLPVHPQACFLPEHSERELVSATTLHAAQVACARWGETGIKDCIYDVIATGNLEIADAEVY